jgi:hypothetical protein
MARSKKIELTERGYLSESAIKAYVSGSLPEEQKAEFLSLLESDPFAKEAVEGMSNAGFKTTENAVQAIHLKVSEKTGYQNTKKESIHINWSIFAYAAAFIGVLVGIGFLSNFFINNYSDKQLAMAESSEEVAATSALKEPEVAPMPIDTSMNGVSLAAPSEVVENAALSTPLQSANELADEYKREETIITERVKVNEEPAAMSGDVAAATSPSAKLEMENKKSKSLQSAAADKEADDVLSKSTPNQDYYQLGMQYFNSGDYKSAENTFTEATRLNPNNLDALYFEGISSHINGNNTKAEQKFDQLLSKGAYTEGSKWYKAKILLKKGKKEEARKLLLELSGSKGIFKERADNQLQKLD